MTSAQLRKKAIQAIDRRGCLLLYPLANRAQPRSVWAELFPRSQMRWEWNADGDNRVAELWHLREQLSRSGQVVYAKWFQNRATLFSTEIFVLLLAYFRGQEALQTLTRDSLNILEFLMSDSPLSTKQIKVAAELEGRLSEPIYNRAMKPLWHHLFIVGYGEFEDSSFPSLGIGATQILFEDLWLAAARIPRDRACLALDAKLGTDNPFWKFAQKVLRSATQSLTSLSSAKSAQFS